MLDYKPAELKAAKSGPAYWYRDSTHREGWLGFAYTAYRLITGRKKASNF
jgi:hypothetical protein